MFFLKKKKVEVPTMVGPAVGASLLRNGPFPEVQPTALEPMAECVAQAVDGKPPQAAFRDSPIVGQDQLAFVTQGSAAAPPLAFVNVLPRIEVWELAPDGSRAFVRKRQVRFDPKQDDWVLHQISEIACLPKDRVLLSISHGDGTSLYVYDIAANSCTKLGAVTALGMVPEKLFQNSQHLTDPQIVRAGLLGRDPVQRIVPRQGASG